MARKDIRIRASGGGEFDCYLAMPQAGGETAAVVLASAVHGVDKDIRDLADEFAGHGFIAAAPDLLEALIAIENDCERWFSPLPGDVNAEDLLAAFQSAAARAIAKAEDR